MLKNSGRMLLTRWEGVGKGNQQPEQEGGGLWSVAHKESEAISADIRAWAQANSLHLHLHLHQYRRVPVNVLNLSGLVNLQMSLELGPSSIDLLKELYRKYTAELPLLLSWDFYQQYIFILCNLHL